ncbi:hypothetical protein BDR07DRAFT_1443549 [Suillus spraguei]|nr:hypothetical protein BDR07DRAFT_1443549 [Suillus spraguei]
MSSQRSKSHPYSRAPSHHQDGLSPNGCKVPTVIGLSLIPAFGALYQRLTLPEFTRGRRKQN